MLDIQNLSVTFNAGSIDEKNVLHDLNLHVETGEFICIIGSNGAGKSTILNTTAGSIIPDKGKILLDDTDITYVKEYQRASYIGRLFQDPLKGTAPNMTIEENLALACLSAKEKKSPFSWITNKERELFKEQLKMLDMGLEDRMHTLVGNLSGGQRQALTLLMATIVPPKLLLLDEHTAALDPKAATKIMKLTQEIVQKHHITCLMVTHQMQQALEVGNRTIMMNDGHIVIDIKSEQRANMSVYDLMERFHENTGSDLVDDRILLAK
jgi:hypothetical protein